MGFPKQEYWSGLPCPSPGDLPDPGIESTSLMSPELAGGFLPLVLPGKPSDIVCVVLCLVAQLCLTFYDPMDGSPPGSCHRGSPGKNTGVGCPALFRGIFSTQGSNQVSYIAGGFFTI